MNNIDFFLTFLFDVSNLSNSYYSYKKKVCICLRRYCRFKNEMNEKKKINLNIFVLKKKIV